MSVPHEVLAAGWIPFVIVTVLILLFSFVYIRCYRHRTESNYCSTVTSFLGLSITLAICALVPVDIFLVSFMKDSHGRFKPWAENEESRTSIENGVLYTYYGLYSSMIVFLFFLLPFSFFYCVDEEEEMTVRWRCCNGLKYAAIFVLMAAVLIMIGAFVPFSETPVNGTSTASEWEIIKNIFTNLDTTHGENALSFTISALTFVSMFPLVLYLGCGSAMWPIDLMKGQRSVAREYDEAAEERIITRAAADAIRSSHRTLSSSDRQRVEELGEHERLIQRRERHLLAAQKSRWRRCSRRVFRPFEVVFGVVFLLVSLLIFVSLLLTNIDKIINSPGAQKGYILMMRHLPNPIDITLVYAQQVFPLDYILIIGLILFLFFCAVVAIKTLGIYCFCVRMSKIRLGRTRPQGLILLCFLLMLVVLGLNVLVYEMSPQYGTFGSQKYIKNITNPDGNTTSSVTPCATSASHNDCIMTRMSMLLFRFVYKFWFFGATFYWASWIFLGVFLVALVVSVVRRRRSSVDNEIDEDEFDSDDELIHG